MAKAVRDPWGWVRDKWPPFRRRQLKRIFWNENNRITIKITLMCVPKGLFSIIPALVLIMGWRRPGDKPLSEPMMVRSLTHICVTRPQWVKAKHQVWLYNSGMPWLDGIIFDVIDICLKYPMPLRTYRISPFNTSVRSSVSISKSS